MTRAARISPVKPAPRLHVTFSQSAAGSLMLALAELDRRDDRVRCLHDRLNVGPIAPADHARRQAWFEAEPHLWINDGAPACDEAFWNEVVPHPEPIVWMSRRSAHEVCGLLELLWRRRRPVRLVDVGAIDFGPPLDAHTSFGRVSHQSILQRKLLAKARRISPAKLDVFVRRWTRIQADNTPLRIVTRTGPVSVPLTYFDDMIVASTPSAWTRHVVVIATMLSAQTAYAHVDEDFVFSRIGHLIDARRLDARGDFTDFGDGYIRRSKRGD